MTPRASGPGRLLALLFALLATGCGDTFFHPAADDGDAQLGMTIARTIDAPGAPMASLAAAFERVDRVRVLVRAVESGALLADETVSVSSGAAEIRLALTIPLSAPEVPVTVEVLLQQGSDVLFRIVSSTVLGRSGTTPIEVTPVPEPAGVNPGTTPSPLASIGDTVRVAASVILASGDVIPGLVPVWSSQTPGVASVTPDGLVTAQGEGTTGLVATFEGLTATLQLQVALRAVSLTLDAESLTLAEGDQATLAVTPTDARGNDFPATGVAWSSSDTGVASVSTAGVVTAEAAGSATITATRDGVSASAQLLVTRRAASIQISPESLDLFVTQEATLEARVLDASGEPIEPPTVAWSSDDPAVASVDADGTVTGVAVGSTTLRARRDGLEAAIPVQVDSRVSRIEVDPVDLGLGIGGSFRLQARVFDPAGVQLLPPDVTWSSENPEVAEVDATGFVQGNAVGETRIVASREGVSAAANIVVAQTPTVVDVIPASRVFSLGDTLTYTAVVRDQVGNVLQVDGIEWETVGSGVASIDSETGFMVVTGIGSTQVRAVLPGGLSGVALVLVPDPGSELEIEGMQGDVEIGPGNTLIGSFQNRIFTQSVPGTARWTILGVPGQPAGVTIEQPYPGTSSFATVLRGGVNLSQLVPLPGAYTLRASAVNAAGASVNVIDSSFVLVQPIISLEGDSQSGDVELSWSWTGNSSEFLPSYTVQRRAAGSPFWGFAGGTSSQTFTDVNYGVTESAFNEYRVQVCISGEFFGCSPYSLPIVVEVPIPSSQAEELLGEESEAGGEVEQPWLADPAPRIPDPSPFSPRSAPWEGRRRSSRRGRSGPPCEPRACCRSGR